MPLLLLTSDPSSCTCEGACDEGACDGGGIPEVNCVDSGGEKLGGGAFMEDVLFASASLADQIAWASEAVGGYFGSTIRPRIGGCFCFANSSVVWGR